MRRLAVLCVLLTAGCLPRGVTPAGNSTGIGVLVQATTKRCTRVLTGTESRRVCLPRSGATSPDSTAQAGPVAGADAR